MNYGSLPDWLSAVGGTGTVIAALILTRGENRRAKGAEAMLAWQASDQASAVKKHFQTIVERAYQAIEQTLTAFGVEQDDAAYYKQYDLFGATLRSTVGRLQRLITFPATPLDTFLASDELIALLDSPQLTGPLDEKVIIAIQDLRAQLSRLRTETGS